MEDRVVETPSGYKVYLRPWVSYPKYIEMQKAFLNKTTVNPQTKDATTQEISASLVLEVEEELNRYLIKKIEKDGRVVATSDDDYLPLPPEDCMAVKAVIDEISNRAAEAFNKKIDDVTIEVFKAYSSNLPLHGDEDLQIVHMCYMLKIPYVTGGFVEQPAWWVNTMLAYIAGKNKAEQAMAENQ